LEENFDELIDAFGRDIFRFVRAQTRDTAEAEDLTQEVFVRAYKHRQKLADIGDVKAWLFQITINVCRDFARKKRRHPLVYLRDVPAVMSSKAAEDEAEDRETHRDLLDTVLQLPAKFKEVILLYYVEEYSIAQIACMLQIPEGTVKTRLHRARNQLRRIRGDHNAETTRTD
jgi:RNA polymerase sigma-70 factor (ECF subfamily)